MKYSKELLINKISIVAEKELSEHERKVLCSILNSTPINKHQQNYLVSLKKKYLKTPHKMKNFIDRWLTKQLPKDKQECIILKKEGNELVEYKATWVAYKPENYPVENQPYQGYLGTFESDNIGFHVWEQNKNEIRYWKPILKT